MSRNLAQLQSSSHLDRGMNDLCLTVNGYYSNPISVAQGTSLVNE